MGRVGAAGNAGGRSSASRIDGDQAPTRNEALEASAQGDRPTTRNSADPRLKRGGDLVRHLVVQVEIGN